ncbi:hypothetical protein SFC66_13070 [Terribacillus saccharophilus]|uniref:hypothetical protein n=1 Tax=Terribacillus saccharophilus TaxID=361277 RepID=UPI0039825BA1
MLLTKTKSFNKLRLQYNYKKGNLDQVKSELQKGDIIVTKSVGFNGFIGHVGILVSSTQILHTSRWIGYPYPKLITVESFKKRYNKIIIIRPKSAHIGRKAADIALEHFYNKDIRYKITRNPKLKKDSTYCSELVWFSYYKAGLEFKVISKTYLKGGSWVSPGRKGFIYPYDFANPLHLRFNGFKYIHIS